MAMDDRDGVIWMDGEYVAWRDAKVHVLTHTLHYGLGVFEGVRAYKTDRGTAIFRLADHTKRFLASGHILEHEDAVRRRHAERGAAAHRARERARVRLHPPAGVLRLRRPRPARDSLSVHVAIATWEWGAYLGAENMERGIRVCTALSTATTSTRP